MADEGKLTDEIIAGLELGRYKYDSTLSVIVQRGKKSIGRYFEYSYTNKDMKFKYARIGAFPKISLEDAIILREEFRRKLQSVADHVALTKERVLNNAKNKTGRVVGVNLKVTPAEAGEIGEYGGGSIQDGIRKIVNDFMERAAKMRKLGLDPRDYEG